MEITQGKKTLKNLTALKTFFENPDNKQKIKKAICTRGRFFCRHGNGEIYYLPLGTTSTGKNVTVKLWYGNGRFEVMDAIEKNVYVG